MAEKLLVNYKHSKSYTSTLYNVIGASTNQTLRTVTAHNDSNCKYVRKFGLAYTCTQVTNIAAVPTGLTFTVKALDGTVLGSRTGGGSFVAGSTLGSAQAIYLAITGDGSHACGTSISITTNVDGSGYTFVLSNEVVPNLTIYNMYMAYSGSTYYDVNLMYGGARHTPDGTQRLPYFTISSALTYMDTYFYICTVLDSCTYDEEITISGEYTLQAALGQTPKITSGVGARITREVYHDGNNSDTVYVSKLGSNSTGTGTYQNPYLTIYNAFTNRGSKTYVNVKDSGQYSEVSRIVLDFSGVIVFEPCYGCIPTIVCNDDDFFFSDYVGVSYTGDKIIKGFIFDGQYSHREAVKLWITLSDASTIGISDCTAEHFTGIPGGVEHNMTRNGILFACAYGSGTSYINNCLVRNNSTTRGYGIVGGGKVSVNKCIAYNGYIGIKLLDDNLSATMSNCASYNQVKHGFEIITSSPGTGSRSTVSNNVAFNNTDTGIEVYEYYDSDPTFTKNISNGNGVYGFFCDRTITITYHNFYDNATNYNVNVTSNNEILTDTKFCNTITNLYEFGLSANSPCYKTDGAENDIGTILRNILISSNNVTINGFDIDGQSQYNNAIGKTGSSDYNGLQVKWCSIYDYQGIAIDDYSGTDTITTISNCKIYYNGNGIKLTREVNTIQENLIYSNTIFGIHCDYAVNTFNHLVLFGNQYGLYLESTSGPNLVKNSIFNMNSLFGIYSEVDLLPLYCCITDAISNDVDISDESNFVDNPLFINTNAGEEDFNIKSKNNGFMFDSVCLDNADDGYDIGAYLVNFSIDEDTWRKYEFAFNPPHVSFLLNGKDYLKFENALGDESNYAKGHRRSFEFVFDDNQVSSEELRQKMEYFTTLIQTRENQLEYEQTKFRLHLLPDSYLLSGTGTINATTGILTDVTKNKTENQYKGFWIGIIFESGIGLVINATAKTAQKAAAGWTVNEWTGYYFYHNGYYYYIKSNTTDTLTLSDSDDTLIDETVNYTIEKYFRIEENYQDEFSLVDDDNELISGTYSYYIDFILCRIANDDFKYNQPKFKMDKEYNKTNFSVKFEEINN